jgi:iron complex outermembrane receptor protein
MKLMSSACWGLLAMALGISLRPCCAADADTGAADVPGVLQEVVVTARRQDEDQEKVPVAVDSLSATALAQQHITTEQELQSAVPGLLAVASTNSNLLAFSIRGQALDAYSYTSPTVLTYFNEFQTGGSTATPFFDLQSIQVLKGPQGTLFGRNATGGAVLYTSTPPGKDLDGYLDYTAGDFNEQKAEGALTLPLTSWASVRLAGVDEHRDGYEQNVYLDIDQGSVDNRALRGTLRLTPVDALENSTTVQYGREGGNSGGLKVDSVNVACPSSPSCAGAELFPAGAPTGGTYPAKLNSYNGLANFVALEATQPFWNIWNDSDGGHDALLKEAVNKTTFTVNDDVSIRNIIGYNRVTSLDRTDSDGSPFAIIASGIGNGSNTNGILYSTEQYSEELQLAGLTDSRHLNYLIGGYYGRDNEGQNIPLNVACGSIAFPETAGNPNGCEVPSGFRYNFANDEVSRALFGQVSYDLIDDVKATAGYRETWENVTFRYVDDGSVPEDTHQLAGVPAPPPLGEHEPSWTLGLDYQPAPSTLIYLTQRGGFRVGGFNGTSIVQTSNGTTNIDSFKPELARDLELGVKYVQRVGSIPLRINADVFAEKVDDAQRVVYAGVASFTVNANQSQIAGLELNAQIELTPSVEAGVNYAYADPRYTDGATHFTQVDALTGSIDERSVILGPYGDATRNAGSFYVRFNHELPHSLGELVVRQDLYSQGLFYYSNLAASINVPPNGIGPLDPNTRISGYTLLNARVEWNAIAGSKVTVAAYVRNMLNRQYEVGGLGLGAVVGVDSVILGTPRMAAVEIGCKL